jgi:ribose transport system substrate-binding protein
LFSTAHDTKKTVITQFSVGGAPCPRRLGPSIAAVAVGVSLALQVVHFLVIAQSRSLTSALVVLSEDSSGRYYDQVVRGAEKAAKDANPNVRFAAVSSTNNPDVQTDQIVAAMRDGVDLIVIQRTYAGDGSAAVQRARAAGITVVAIDADVPGGTDAVVKPDERQGGGLAARFVATKLSGKGKVAIANGPADAAPIQLRVAGFVSELHRFPAIEIVANRNTGMTRDGARRVMSEFLADYPDLNAVYGVNDPVAYYCEQEALERRRSDVFIVGMEGSPTSVAAMTSPERLIAASPGEDPFVVGETAVKIGAAIVAGNRPAQTDVLIPFVELSRANAKGYRGWNHGAER